MDRAPFSGRVWRIVVAVGPALLSFVFSVIGVALWGGGVVFLVVPALLAGLVLGYIDGSRWSWDMGFTQGHSRGVDRGLRLAEDATDEAADFRWDVQ